nr:uncharacterized protein LOC124814614 isoform X2 [Hydra vulgaris]
MMKRLAQKKMFYRMKLSLRSRNLERFDSGFYWNKRSIYRIVNLHEVIKYKDRVFIATSMQKCILKRCSNVSDVFAEADELLNTVEWTESDFFTAENNKKLHKNMLDNNIKALIDDDMLRQQFEYKRVDVGKFFIRVDNIEENNGNLDKCKFKIISTAILVTNSD